MVKLSQVIEFKSCLTCVYRKPYPASMREGQPVFYRFFCSISPDSLKDVVRPEDSCGCWKEVTPGID